MIVDSLVSSSISSYAESTEKFVSISLGNNDHVSDSFEIAFNEETSPIIAEQRSQLARTVNPELEIVGYLFVNYGLEPADIRLRSDAKYLVLLELRSETTTPHLSAEEVRCLAFSASEGQWTPHVMTIKGDAAVEAAMTSVYGEHNELNVRRAKQVSSRRIRRLHEELGRSQVVHKQNNANRDDQQSAHAEIGRIIAVTGQSRKSMPHSLEGHEEEENDRVVYEMLAQVISS